MAALVDSCIIEDVLIFTGKQVRRYDHQKLLETGTEYICGMFISDGKLWGAACGQGVISIDVFVGGKK